MPETPEIHGARTGSGCSRLPAAAPGRCSRSLCGASEKWQKTAVSEWLEWLRDVKAVLRWLYLSPQTTFAVHAEEQGWGQSLDDYVAWVDRFQLQHTWKHRNMNGWVVFRNLLLLSMFWASKDPVYVSEKCLLCCLLPLILTVKCLNFTSWHSAVLGHLEIHASPVVIWDTKKKGRQKSAYWRSNIVASISHICIKSVTKFVIVNVTFINTANLTWLSKVLYKVKR